jgi:hypothetical protein
MTITKEIKEKALEIGRKHKLAKVWVNNQGEVFSEEQYAKASVKGDKDKYALVEISAKVKEATTNELGSVQEVIGAIELADTKEAVELIVAAEKEGKNRKTVFDAAEKKLATFSK